MAKVTLISAYHKRAGAVRMTLTAMARQSYDDWTACVWDDGSPDNTWEMLQKVQGELGDARIEVFRHTPNVGFVAGMNHAIARTDSDYVAVVGSGDAFAPDRIARQVAALDADPEAVFCTTAAISIDPDTGERFEDNTFSRTRIEAGDLAHSCPFTHGSVMFRRAALERVGLYEPTFVWSSDWDLFNRLLTEAHAIHLPEPLYHRYARADGASFSPEKSVLQVKSAHLAHALREAPERRGDILDLVRREGIDAALTGRHAAIAADLCSRQAKLYILGRKDLADEMGTLIAADYPVDAKWQTILGLLRALSALPLVRFYGVAHATNQMRKRLRGRTS